jgi:hypothetical protein
LTDIKNELSKSTSVSRFFCSFNIEGLSVAEVDAFSVVEELDIVVEVEEDEENDSWDFKIIVSSMTKFNVFYCGMIVLLFFLLLDIL